MLTSTLNEERTRERFGVLAPKITQRFYPRVIVNCNACGAEREICFQNKKKPCYRCSISHPEENNRTTREILEGQKFGRLTIQTFEGKTTSGQMLYRCQCECGKQVTVQAGSLKSGNTKSCGCLHRETTGALQRGKPPVCVLEYGKASANTLLGGYKRNAVKRNLQWSLTNDEFFALTRMNCYYCGTPPLQIHNHSRSHNGSYIYNGVDRLESKKGYSVDNCVAACGRCNRAKLALDVDEFLELVEKIFRYRIENDRRRLLVS